MSKKSNDWKNALGQMVFSTHNEDASSQQDFFDEDEPSIEPGEQRLRIWLDKKSRKGKAVTLITGFDGSDEEIKELAGDLKKLCGVGGTVKNHEILIQGDHREKVKSHLIKKGYSGTKTAGG
jgi:translation initiation factor 1